MRRPILALLVLVLAPSIAAQLGPALRERMALAAADESLPAYVLLHDAVDLGAMQTQLVGRSPSERRVRVIAALKQRASQTQVRARQLVELAQSTGAARLRRVLWMGNALLIDAQPNVLARLAALPEVERVELLRDLPVASQQDVPPPLPPGLGDYPFYDDFDSGNLAAHWSVDSSADGYVLVTTDDGPEGSHHVVMASAQAASDSVASITVQLDLSGQSDVGLRFRHKEFGDENHAEDGVFLSTDGSNWQRILALENGSSVYEWRWVALDPLLAPLAPAQRAQVRLRFQWRDDFDRPSDGMAFDRIEVAPGAGQAPLSAPEPNIDLQQAPLLWAQGVDGGGVLIGSIDSGVSLTHPDLVNRLWSNPGEIPGNALDDDANGFVDDVQGWDFQFDDANVTSGDPHGTQSAGLMVGDGTGGRVTGMAPGAELVVCRVANAGQYWEAQQYLFELGVDVISSSYSYKWVDAPDYHMFRALSDAELAGGVVHANSIGNQGLALATHPLPFNISTPGNAPSPFAYPGAVVGGRSSVIACGAINLSNDGLYPLSGIGPSAWDDLTLYDAGWPHAQDTDYHDYPFGGFGGPGPGLLKPDITSYTGVMTTSIGGGYSSFFGTSASTPQLGGALALLRQVQPEALPRHLDAALQLTARDKGPSGKDVNYGAGVVQAWHAARRLVLLLRMEPQEVAIGNTAVLEVFGEANAQVFGFLSADILAGPKLNVLPPVTLISPFPLDVNGERVLNLSVPNDPMLVGATAWVQVAAPASASSPWGPLAFFSVPESVTVTN
ncbi:MAG: hypothetical protein DHS20C15_20200 [Planctomycetota bacterium]|nr:MAG: hypothetical protein DHS20C15_20200 [Planctomycetota bacterium]